MKEITSDELINLLSQSTESRTKKYRSWAKFNPNDFHNLIKIGILKIENPISNEYPTSENYWSNLYPIALNYFPYSGSEIHNEDDILYFIYKDFGGHAPELRCRQINPKLIVI